MASRKILVQEDFVHVSSGSNPAAGYLAFYPKSDNNFYLRTSAGVERRLWDSGNHGPGSGLNADLLDGLHSSEFFTVYQNYNKGEIYNFSGSYSPPAGSQPPVESNFIRQGAGHYFVGFTPLTGKVDILYNIYKRSLADSNIVIATQNVVGSIDGLFDGNQSNNAVTIDAPDPLNPSTFGIIEIGHTNVNNNLFLLYSRDVVCSLLKMEGWGSLGNTNASNNLKSWKFEIRSSLDGQWYTIIDRDNVIDYLDILSFHPFTKELFDAGHRYASAIRLTVRDIVPYTNTNFLRLGGFVLYTHYPNTDIADSVHALSQRGGTGYGNYKLYAGDNYSYNYVLDLYSYTGLSFLKVRNSDGFVGLGVTPTTQLHITGQFRSQLATGTAPFVIASTTVNTNLNADLLDGYHASSFALSSHTHAYLPLSGGTMSNTNLVTNLNADLLDGQHASAFAPASHNHSFAGLSDVALVSPSAGHTLVYNGSAWVNNSQIRSVPGAEYNTIYIRSAESGDDFGDSEMYMTAEEGIYFRTNIGKATAAEASFDRYGIRSSKLMGTGERYLAAGSDGLIKVATVQPTQYWQRDAGNYILSPIESYDEVHAWLFKAGGVLMSDGYLETGRSGMYTVYNDMVVSEFYLSNNTFYYANSKLAFNNSTNLLTVDGGINAGSNLIAAGEVKLTKQTPGGVLRLQSHNAGPDFLRQQDYAGAVTFEAYNGSGYSGVATISARASQNHSGSGMGTNIEFWNYPNNGSNTRPAMILREDGILDNYFGFAVSGSDGKSGTATILTGCSYNSVTKTLIYTRASVTFSGGIVTNIASMSSLSVPLT